MTKSPLPSPQNDFVPKMGLLDTIMLVAGSMIGTGVYIVGTDMLTKLGGSGWFLSMWLLASLLTVIAALSFAELGVLFPFAGGQYVYLKEAYHPMLGFLFGWCSFFVVQSGTIAAVAYGFAKFFSVFHPVFSETNTLFTIFQNPISATNIMGVLSILCLTFIHTKGINGGKTIQTIVTIIKMASMFLLIICGLSFAFDFQIWNMNWQAPFQLKTWNNNTLQWQSISGMLALSLIIPSLVGAFFSNDAWYNVTFVASEIKNPQKNIVRGLIIGTLLVALFYISMNALYLGIATKEEIVNPHSSSLGGLISTKIFGNKGVLILSIMMIISALGCNNGIILSGARIYYSMAKDGLFFKTFGTLNRHHVPAKSLWLQGIWASFLCLSGTYGTILNYVISIVLIFFILGVVAVFVFRKKRPLQHRVYKTWGYPYLPIFYIIITSMICIGLFIFVPQNTLWGLALLCLGVVAFLIIKKNKKAE